MLLISIPTPCHEKWDDMTPNERGAFCHVCTKTVVDFTRLSDEEVKNYFLRHRGQQTCGRFRNDQLTHAGDPLHRLLVAPVPFWKKFLAIVVIVFGSLLTGCRDNAADKPEATEMNAREKITFSTTTGLIDSSLPEEIKVDAAITESCSMPENMTLTEDVTMGEPVAVLKDGPEIISGKIVIETEAATLPKKTLDENGNEKIQ